MASLSRFETTLYFCIWISGVVISLYHLHIFGRVFNHSVVDSYQYEDFTEGWEILGRIQQDQADYEWKSWTQLMWSLLPFLSCNFIVAELIRNRKKLNLLPIWYTTVALAFAIYSFNILICLWFVCLALCYYVCVVLKNLLLIWMVTFLVLCFFNMTELWLTISEDEMYLVMISSSWMILRCISFCVDKLKDMTHQKLSIREHIYEITILLGYSLYLPTMFFGPFILFSYFNKGIHLEFEKWNFKRLRENLFRISRCIFWFLFTEFVLHFVYVNAILLRPNMVERLFEWELAGLGIAMGHFFHLKYVVFYGIPCAWAAAEGFKTPEVPCCVSRIHLYSNMWRRFDHGLYEFLIKYIYIPVMSVVKANNKIVRKTPASIACFAFVFAWHRGEMHIFYWVFFNFIAVTIEVLGNELYSMPLVRNFCKRNMSEENILRIQCAVAAPLHYFSMVSNFFFIGNGMNIGLIYLNKFINGSLKSTLTVLFFLYGAGQSSIAIQLWEERTGRTHRKMQS